VVVSALLGDGLDTLRDEIARVIQRTVKKVKIRYPATDGALDAHIRSKAAIHAQDFDDDMVLLTIEADERLLGELSANSTVKITR
jgi:50S ribosomal subunit-associated GTPase HflX